ncbi:hypothetical protein GGR90_002748 [Sphingopyxis italica]|uniref:Uncharacterized protein n=1 Tax=Sphingopyxis italica TaxID=1129133 RepID=A0A7X5XT99_9SPHN|nr:hypothetical protein [Sphingopyxis italica]NJB90554.1 hypothetical protein [Sphingopyxis italica]
MDTITTNTPAGKSPALNPDAAIIAAFDRRSAAFKIARGLPDRPSTDGMTPEQAAQWDIIDAAEEEICSAVAITARGAELQLWTAAAYVLDSALFDGFDDEPHYYSADLDHFISQGADRDWSDRLLLSALRSLRAQGGVA